MDALSMAALADAQLNAARGARVGRAAHTVYGGQGQGHALRQTLLARAADQSLSEHDNPGEATLFVLRGRVELGASTGVVEGNTNDFIVIPEERHHLTALEDSVVLLTVVAKG
ncbi:MAG: cupin domain-containing protein [Actinomycetia bacterium]|nr:cupin domain-containing protein [Actinomycetes bacterium]